MRQKHLKTLEKFKAALIEIEPRKGRNDAEAYLVMFDNKKYRWSATQVDREVPPWLLTKKIPRRYTHKNKHCLYKMYDKEENLLYLGKTNQLDYRLYAHFNKHIEPWKSEIVTITVATFENEADMHIYEMYLITKLKPIFNKDAACVDSPSFELPEVDFEEITGWN